LRKKEKKKEAFKGKGGGGRGEREKGVPARGFFGLLRGESRIGPGVGLERKRGPLRRKDKEKRGGEWEEGAEVSLPYNIYSTYSYLCQRNERDENREKGLSRKRGGRGRKRKECPVTFFSFQHKLILASVGLLSRQTKKRKREKNKKKKKSGGRKCNGNLFSPAIFSTFSFFGSLNGSRAIGRGGGLRGKKKKREGGREGEIVRGARPSSSCRIPACSNKTYGKGGGGGEGR